VWCVCLLCVCVFVVGVCMFLSKKVTCYSPIVACCMCVCVRVCLFKGK